MHIPKAETAQLELTPFDAALSAALTPQPDYDIARWLYVPPTYEEYRYILGTRGQRPLICMGINPSTAAPDHLDRTLAIRGADCPGQWLRQLSDVQCVRPAGHQPRHHGALLQSGTAPGESAGVFLSAGAVPGTGPSGLPGAPSSKNDRTLADCLADQIALGRRCHARWFTAGPISRKGHPHHPLYLRKDTVLDPFDPEAYCQDVLGRVPQWT